MNEEIQRIDLGFVNAYLLLAGEGFILIDTGMPQQWNRLETALLKAGCLPDHLKLVVLTHGDMDHTGNCARLQAKCHTRIALHPADLAMATAGAPLKRHSRSMLGNIFLFIGSLAGGRGSPQAFKPDILLEDGQELAEFGLAAKVIHTPGHTPGSIAILTKQGQLFAGDTLSKRNRVEVAPFIQDDQELRRSLERLKSLNAITIYPGHGEPFAFEEFHSLKF